MDRAVRLTPSFRRKVWGKRHLSPWFPDSAEPVGEVWYLAEQELPLLVKLIFTGERLSVQVHPGDGEIAARGKTEMWYIVEAEPGANLALGFREPITRERLREAARTAEVERLLNWMAVTPGETYLTPAHTVHAIGAGLVLFEIQQNSDVTCRLWDYGRQREIHLEEALPISDLGVHPGPSVPRPIGPGRDELVRDTHFVTELVRLKPGESVAPEPEKCQLWIGIEGCASIGDEPFRRGETWLLPESGAQPGIRAETAARFLRTYVPRS